MEKIKKYLRKKADIKSIDMNEIKQYSKILSSKLITQDIDLIIGLKTGGYIPSILISKKLNKPLKFINIGRDKKRFFGIEVEKNIFLNNIYMQLFRKSQKPNIRSFNDDGIEGKRILLIDDDALSGLTLELAKDFLIKKGAKTVITACLIIYDDSYQSDFYAYKTKRSKILFFSFNKMKKKFTIKRGDRRVSTLKSLRLTYIYPIIIRSINTHTPTNMYIILFFSGETLVDPESSFEEWVLPRELELLDEPDDFAILYYNYNYALLK